MSTINATFAVPTAVRDGLRSGQYERIGGVIRDTHDKHIIAWLRENHLRHAMNLAPSLNAVLPFLGVLNLAISVGGFALVLNRLRNLETGLKDIEQKVSQINQKIDLGNYANLASAIQQANSAFSMSNPRNREASAMQAIDRLLVAEHYFTSLLDEKIKTGQTEEGGAELFSTLCLAHTAEALCYLELNEPKVASERIQLVYDDFRKLVFHLIDYLLRVYSAPYLHPYVLEQEPHDVVTRLWNITRSTHGNDEEYDFIAGQTVKFIDKPGLYTAKGDWGRLNASVRRNLDVMESMLEEVYRFGLYREEIIYYVNNGFSWQEWRDAKPTTPDPDAEYFLILP